MVTYSPPLPDLYSNAQCPFCLKNDIVKNMYIATLDEDGVRVYPIDPSNYVLLCQWCAHFESKIERDTDTFIILNDLIYNSIAGDGQMSDYNGVG